MRSIYFLREKLKLFDIFHYLVAELGSMENSITPKPSSDFRNFFLILIEVCTRSGKFLNEKVII